MRKLQTSDVFAALRAIKKANLKEELKPIIKQAASGEMNLEDVGITGILSILEIASEKKAEGAVYEFLAGPFEKTAKEIETLDLEELLDGLAELGRENNLRRFFTALAGMMSKN